MQAGGFSRYASTAISGSGVLAALWIKASLHSLSNLPVVVPEVVMTLLLMLMLIHLGANYRPF